VDFAIVFVDAGADVLAELAGKSKRLSDFLDVLSGRTGYDLAKAQRALGLVWRRNADWKAA
jgi:hypothetical protein